MLIMAPFSFTHIAILLGILAVNCCVPVTVDGYIRPLALITRDTRHAVKSTGNLRMVLEIAAPTEEPKANALDAIMPEAVSKQYSSSRVSSINLLKNCLGAGVFSLNARVSSISVNPATIVPAAAVIFAMAMWATYNFYMVSGIIIISLLWSS